MYAAKEYNSGEHIQHLSALIRVLTSERYSSPVDWAEDQFAKPLGLQGLFAHDGLDGDISIGGGQLMSCSQLARRGLGCLGTAKGLMELKVLFFSTP